MIARSITKITHHLVAGFAVLILASCGGGSGAKTTVPPINGGLEVTPSSIEASGICEIYEPVYSGIAIRSVSAEVDALSADYAPGFSSQSWLDIQFVDMPGNVGFTFTTEGSNLEPGTYTTALRLTTLKKDKSIIGFVDVPITFKNKRQLFLAGAEEIKAGHIIGSGQPVNAAYFELYGKGISWTAKADQPWMTLNSQSGTAPEKGNISFDITKMQMGLNKGTLVFTPTDASALLTANVFFNLSPTSLQVLNPGLDFYFIKGERQLRPDKFFSIGSNGNALKWTAIADVPWLGLSTTGGVASFGTSNTNVVVTANVLNLSIGQYFGAIKITDETGAVQTLPVTLDYKAPSLQSFGSTTLSLNFDSVIGGAPPASATALITSNGDSVDWVAKSNQSWIRLGNSTGLTPAQLPVSIDPKGLAVGSYNGSIAISSSSGGDYVVQVSYSIKP